MIITSDNADEPDNAAVLSIVARVAFTARNGPSWDEARHFPRWKRAALRITPRKYRWKFSDFAPLIAEYNENYRRAIAK